jgi:hypothetical protein
VIGAGRLGQGGSGRIGLESLKSQMGLGWALGGMGFGDCQGGAGTCDLLASIFLDPHCIAAVLCQVLTEVAPLDGEYQPPTSVLTPSPNVAEATDRQRVLIQSLGMTRLKTCNLPAHEAPPLSAIRWLVGWLVCWLVGLLVGSSPYCFAQRELEPGWSLALVYSECHKSYQSIT